MKSPPWQVPTTLWIGTLGPPHAGLVLMTTTYLHFFKSPTEPLDVPGFVVAFFLFAVPVSYIVGVVPALLAGVMYCSAVTGVGTLRQGMLPRACLGAICGGSVAGVWFRAVIGPDSQAYGLAAALVMAVLSLRCPRVRSGTISRYESLEKRPAVPGEGIRAVSTLCDDRRASDDRRTCHSRSRRLHLLSVARGPGGAVSSPRGSHSLLKEASS
jgi:hypothetical protein